MYFSIVLWHGLITTLFLDSPPCQLSPQEKTRKKEKAMTIFSILIRNQFVIQQQLEQQLGVVA